MKPHTKAMIFQWFCKQIREKQGLTREQFARKLGISVNAYCNIEQARKVHQCVWTYKAIADFEGISVDSLLREIERCAKELSESGRTSVYMGLNYKAPGLMYESEH